MVLVRKKKSFLWTRLRREGSEGSEGKVLKMDRPAAGGFLSLTGPLAPRVVVSPYRAMSIKSALRDLLSVSYDMKTILLTGSLRSPPQKKGRGWRRGLCRRVVFASLRGRRPFGPRVADCPYGQWVL